MTDEEEFAARAQLKWTRDGDAWILLYRRRRMGRVVPDKDHPGMWRSVKVDGILSNTANLSWSKDNVMAQAIREVAWNAANDPQKCPVKEGSREQKTPPMRLNAGGWLQSNSRPTTGMRKEVSRCSNPAHRHRRIHPPLIPTQSWVKSRSVLAVCWYFATERRLACLTNPLA